MKAKSYAVLLITSKALDARRRGVTTEAYGPIRRKEERSLARLWREGNAARQIPSWRGDDALMVDQGQGFHLDTFNPVPYSPESLPSTR